MAIGGSITATTQLSTRHTPCTSISHSHCGACSESSRVVIGPSSEESASERIAEGTFAPLMVSQRMQNNKSSITGTPVLGLRKRRSRRRSSSRRGEGAAKTQAAQSCSARRTSAATDRSSSDWREYPRACSCSFARFSAWRTCSCRARSKPKKPFSASRMPSSGQSSRSATQPAGSDSGRRGRRASARFCTTGSMSRGRWGGRGKRSLPDTSRMAESSSSSPFLSRAVMQTTGMPSFWESSVWSM